MQNKSTLFKVAAFVAVAIVIGVGLGWLASRPKTATNNTPAPEQERAAAQAEAAVRKPVAPPAHAEADPAAAAMTAGSQPAEPKLPDWADKIGDILVNDAEIPEKAKQLLKIYPDLPEEGKQEAIGHLNNLVDDDNYQEMGKILVDPKTSKPIAEEMLHDLFNRPNPLKLPLMLQVARTPGHAGAEAAHEDLALLLEEDYGTDWTKWEEATKKYIKENPE